MIRSKRSALIFFGMLGLLLVLRPVASGQHIRGALEGAVSDANGAVVEGATITLKSATTGAETTSTTDDRGRFNFQNLLAGLYSVSVDKAGFKKFTATDVTVKVGSVTPLMATLEVGAATETVNVVSVSEATVDTSRPTVDGVVTPKQIENLPLNGRNFLDLAQQEPGVQVRDGGDFDPTKNQMVGVSMGGRSALWPSPPATRASIPPA